MAVGVSDGSAGIEDVGAGVGAKVALGVAAGFVGTLVEVGVGLAEEAAVADADNGALDGPLVSTDAGALQAVTRATSKDAPSL